MGYTTTFDGEFGISPSLTAEHAAYLETFARSRRKRRNPALAGLLPDLVREAAGPPIGREAGYFVGGPDQLGDQSGLWCQ